MLMIVYLDNMTAIAQTQCFANQRFPKVIQSQSTPTESNAYAVTIHEGLNAIFVGGYVTQPSFIPLQHFAEHDEWEHVGRIQLANNMWAWSKIISSQSLEKSAETRVISLAVDPIGIKVATITATINSDNSKFINLFLLDASTGAIISKRLVYELLDFPLHLNSKNMLL